MATAGDERVPYEGGGAEKKLRKRPFLSEVSEEPQNVSQEAGQYNSSGASENSTHQGGNLANICATIGVSELEQILIQKTLTRSEIQRLLVVLHSKIFEESPSNIIVNERDGTKHPPPPPSSPSSDIRLEAATTSGSLKKHKHGHESDNFHPAAFSSRVVEQQITSPVELTNAYKGGNYQAPSQDLELFNNSATGLPKTLKALPQYPSTIEKLPEELLSNIFIRLMAKQLARMRSVSKSWNTLLSQPSFIKSHLHCSIQNSDHLLAFYEENFSTYHLEPFTVHGFHRYSHQKLPNFIKLPVNPQFENANVVRVIGSVNGLVCYSHSNTVIHIWNPSLSAVLTLPPYSMPSHGFLSIGIYFRFGYDPKTDDYKVVKLTGLFKPGTSGVKWWLQVEIYSMRKGTWELITERFPSHITGFGVGDNVCVDGHGGHLHWICSMDRTWSQTIVAFDLGSETFREMSLPDLIVDYLWIVLGVLLEKLCVVSFVLYETFDVWLMAEYGVAESWGKYFVIPQYSACPSVFGFTSHNDFLVVYDGYIVLYDLEENQTTTLEIFCHGRDGPDKIVEYVESLVWVAPAKHEMVEGA